MSIYYILYPNGNLSDTWLFFELNNAGKLVPRKEIEDLVCRTCGKFDEDVAILRGINDKVDVRSKSDWIATSDDCIVVSDKFRDYINSANIQGLRFLPLRNAGHALVVCDIRVQTHEVLAGFDNRQKCVTCGRYRERLIGPLLGGMAIPEEKHVLFVSDIANENAKVGYRPVFAGMAVVKGLKAAKFKGIDFVEAM